MDLVKARLSENRMRLLYITATLPFDDGEAFLIPEVDELQRLGCEVLIVPRNPSGNIVHRDATALREHCEAMPLFSWKIFLAAAATCFMHPLRTIAAFCLLLRAPRPTTFLKNLAVFPKGLWLGRLARQRQVDHIHAHWFSTPATMAMIASRLSGIPWSCTAHRVDIALDNLLREKLARATFVRFISASGAAMAESLGGCPAVDKTAVIHVGVEIPEGGVGPISAAGPLTILCPANLYPVKGHSHLIRAMGQLRDRGVDCRLQLAGQGGTRPELERLTRELGLDRIVQFLGQVPHDEILAMYARRQINILVLPSLDLGNHLHEGIPVCLMEAMAYGIPVVSTATGGIPELLTADAGVVVPPGDSAALADAIERLAGDADLRQRFAQRGRRRVEEQFSVRAVVPVLLARIGASERCNPSR